MRVTQYLCLRLSGHQLVRRDTERARAILRDLLGEITLQPDDKGLVAVLQGNVPGILGLPFYNRGAGSQASRLSKVCHIRVGWRPPANLRRRTA